MTPHLRALAVTLAAGAVATVLTGCGSDRPTLTIYSGRTENLVGPLLTQYAEANDVDIEIRYGGSADLALLLDEEGDRSPADVFISQSPGPLGYLSGDDRLVELPADVLDLVPEDARASDGRWVGLSGRVRTLVYNTDLVDEADLPDSIIDLTGEEYRGRVALAPSNGSFQDFVTAFRDIDGDDTAAEWLAGMSANDSPAYANNTAIVAAVARGEVDMGLVNHYYNYRQVIEEPDSPTSNHFFADGDIGNLLLVTGAATLGTADDTELAADFIRFLLTEQAQTFFSEETFEYPLASDVEPYADLPPLTSLGISTFDVNSLGGGLVRTEELIRDSGVDTSG